MMDEQRHYEPSTFERWALRSLIAALVGLVSWIGIRAINGQDATTTAVRGLTTQMAVMQSQVNGISSQLSDTNQLTRQIAVMQETQQDHERRLEMLEQRNQGHGQ